MDRESEGEIAYRDPPFTIARVKSRWYIVQDDVPGVLADRPSLRAARIFVERKRDELEIIEAAFQFMLAAQKFAHFYQRANFPELSDARIAVDTLAYNYMENRELFCELADHLGVPLGRETMRKLNRLQNALQPWNME